MRNPTCGQIGDLVSFARAGGGRKHPSRHATRLGRPCIQGDYVPLVANLLTADALEKITRSVLAKLRPLARIQRETVIRAVLEDDYRARRSHGFGSTTTFAAAVQRDGVM